MKTIILTVILAVLVFYGIVRYLEKTSIFYPARMISVTPKNFGLHFEDIYFRTKDGVKLNGWLIKNPQATSTVFFAHGNAGNISGRLVKMKDFYDLGLNVFIFDYRGYGRSKGYPTENGVYRDAHAAFDYVRGRMNGSIIGYGASLGGVVIIDLACQRPLAALIVDSAFSSAADMSRIYYPFVPTWMLSLRMDSFEKIHRVNVPKLFIHSPDDELVPIKLAHKLFAAAPLPKTFFEVTGGHNDLRDITNVDFWNNVRAFLSQYVFIDKV